MGLGRRGYRAGLVLGGAGGKGRGRGLEVPGAQGRATGRGANDAQGEEDKEEHREKEN